MKTVVDAINYLKGDIYGSGFGGVEDMDFLYWSHGKCPVTRVLALTGSNSGDSIYTFICHVDDFKDMVRDMSKGIY